MGVHRNFRIPSGEAGKPVTLTAQIRTDDKTKTASAALFEQPGITMSEAINLFLRQSVMRGLIPFPVKEE